MKPIAIILCIFVLITSCQTSEPVQKENMAAQGSPSQKLETASNERARLESKDAKTSRNKMSQPVPQPQPRPLKQNLPKAPSFPPNTISNCPAGMNGSLVGQIEQGRYCFTNISEAPLQCLDRNDEPVRRQAEVYCQNLKNHWARTGVWKYGPDLDLKIGQLKRSSCQCGLWRGQSLCKSFFKFKCQTVRL